MVSQKGKRVMPVLDWKKKGGVGFLFLWREFDELYFYIVFYCFLLCTEWKVRFDDRKG